jgi:hypothetical protein
MVGCKRVGYQAGIVSQAEKDLSRISLRGF